MGVAENSIRQSIQKMAKAIMPEEAILCSVVDVDLDTSTCTVEPLNGDAVIFEVKLQADETKDYGVIPIPVVKSTVAVVFLDKDTAFVSLISQIESYKIKINSIDLIINSDGIMLNGTEFGGLVKINELIKQLDKLTALWDAYLSVVTGAPIPEPGNGSPSALQTALNSAVATLTTPNYGDIENEKVKHGDN